MIYKLTSIKTIIGQIVTNLGMGDTEIPIDDMIEWIAQGLAHIGSYAQFTPREANIEIENYKGELPCDFYKLSRELYNNQYLINNNTIINNNQKEIQSNQYSNRDINIINSTIITSFESGSINLQYLAMPVDSDGLPLVPDDPSFMDALFWRCVYQLSLRGYQFKKAELNDLMFTKRMWNIYCAQSKAAADAPNLDMVERLKNNYTRFIRKDEYINNFSTLGMKEQLTLTGRNYFRNN